MFAFIAGLPSCEEETTRGPSDEWVQYQDTLSEIDDIQAIPPVVYQLDWGGISVVFDPLGRQIAQVRTVQEDDINFTEYWFFDLPTRPPGEAFEFRFGCKPCNLGDPEAPPLQGNWEALPFYEQSVRYLDGLPPKAITDKLTLVNNEIDRYTFQMMSGNDTVGYLLREDNHPVGQQFLVDHWVFLPNYVAPSPEQDSVAVNVHPTQYATAAQFFAALQGVGVEHYAKVKYSEDVGANYAP